MGEMSGRKALDPAAGIGRGTVHLSETTVQSGCNFSSLNAPPRKSFDRPPTPERRDEPIWSNSLRRNSTPRWRPQTTVPRGPELHTSRRVSSVGAVVQDEENIPPSTIPSRQSTPDSRSRAMQEMPGFTSDTPQQAQELWLRNTTNAERSLWVSRRR